MGQWALNLLYVTHNPEQIERMSYSRMKWWNARAEKIIKAMREGGTGA